MSESPFQRRGPRRISREPSERRGDQGEGGDRRRERGTLWVGAVALALATLLLVVLFLPPIELLNDDADGGGEIDTPAAERVSALVEAQTRARMPELPDNLRPVSPIYDLEAAPELAGPIRLTLGLIQPTQDQRNLGAYTYQDGDWTRLNPALLTSDGAGATVELESVPANVAVLRRLQSPGTVTGRLPQGADLAAEAVNALTIVNPVGFVPAADGSLLGRVEALPADVNQPVYPVVIAEAPEADIINNVIASPQLRRQHINNILLMVQTGRYAGVDIDYQVISPALREAFTEFIAGLANDLQLDGRGISISVPLPRRDAAGFNEGAYDLAALGIAVNLLKIVPPLDRSIFREALVTTLPFVLSRVPPEKVLLRLSPHSVARDVEGFTSLTQRDALGLASRLSVREAGPVLAGQRVTLVGDQIYQDAGGTGLRWDAAANMVAFVYPGTTGDPVTVWVENRFGMAFKLQILAEYRLGGIALEDVSAVEGSADLWSLLGTFLETGEAPLALPNPGLLLPQWEVDGGDLSGSGSAGWVVWSTPTIPGAYEVRLIVSDGDVRVGHAIAVTVEP